MFEKQCWKRGQTIKHCLTSKSKQNLGVMFLKKFKTIFCLTQAKNVGKAMFLSVAKQSKILLDKKISNVYQTMFDRLAGA